MNFRPLSVLIVMGVLILLVSISSSTTFLAIDVPSGPILMSPENGTYTTDHIITFGWYNEEWAQKYYL